ncbi:hypothetical protein CM49_03581 [Paenibacillus sp. P1XP2]|nr:hypothetical protein CM49_03581 [Paenibacillus sp. P1XP2]
MTENHAFAANTSGTVIAVVLGGTNVSFPNAQDFGPGITINAANNTFTVANAGNYYISYSVNLNVSLLVSSRILINGSAAPASTISPAVGTTSFQTNVITPVPAGATISIQLFGVLATATLTTTTPTNVTIIRLS